MCPDFFDFTWLCSKLYQALDTNRYKIPKLRNIGNTSRCCNASGVKQYRPFLIYLSTNFMKKLSALLITPWAILASGYLSIASCYAGTIHWYDEGDPLATQKELPPSLAPEYLDVTDNNVCVSINIEKALSLADVAQAALCNNPQTSQAYANAKIQAAQLGIARSAYYPTVTDNAGVNSNVAIPSGSNPRGNPYNNLNNNLVASYLLYDFGNRDANLENARQLLQAASATQIATVQNVLLSAIKAYYQVQADIAALSAAEESEHFNQESFNAAEAKYKAGVLTPADKLQAQTAFAQATLNRITAEGKLKTDYGILANVMGLSANTKLGLVSPTTQKMSNEAEQEIDKLINLAHIRRPDLIASEAQIEAASASIKASQAASKPTISLNVSNNQQLGSDINGTNNTSLGVTVSIPIFTGYANSYQIHAAEATKDLRISQRDQLRLQISLDVWTAYQSLRTATETIKSAEVLVASAKESQRVALGRYKAGVGNIIDTLNAQSALANANQQQIQAMLNWNIAKSTLAQSIGMLDNAMIQSLPDGKNTAQETQP
jgi:outer membrane protein